MKKTITKKIITVLLSAMFAVCCFGVITTSTKTTKASTTDINSVTVAVEQAAEMKSSGNMGIKFNVDISQADYEGLKSSYQSVICGFIIAPKDYVEDVNAMDVDGWTIDEGATSVIKYEGGEPVANTKYFQTDTVNPRLNLETSLYEFSGSFTKIDASNYDREFIVRAYVATKNTGEADYTYKYSGTYSRSVYSVATSALAASGELGSEVLTFVKNVTGSVNTANTNAGRNYTFTVKNLTDGKEEADELKHGDSFSVTASYTNGLGDTIIVIPTIENNTNITDNNDGTYTVNNPTGAEFEFKAVIEGTGKNIEKTITVNRQDVVRTLDQTAFTINDSNLDDDLATTMTVASTDIPAGAEGKTVYAVDYAGNGTGNAIVLDKTNIKAGDYFTFKYYNDGTFLALWDNINVYGTANPLGVSGIYTSTSGYYHNVTIKHYDENGQLIVAPDSSDILAKKGQWCTFEWYFPEGYVGTCPLNIWLNVSQHVSVFPTVYMTDITVSNYSIYNACLDMYEDLQMTVTGGTGTDGAFNPGDEVKITSASVAVKGQTDRLDLDVSKLPLTFTEGAVAKVDGKYIYQGTGNFTVTCNYYGTSKTLDATGIEGAMPVSYETLPLSKVTARSEKVEITQASTGIPTGAPSGDIILATFASDGYDVANGIQISSTGLTKDKYITFRYYLTSQRLCCLEGKWVHSTFADGTASLTYGGKPIATHYAQDGTLIQQDKVGNYANQWVSLEIKFTSGAPSDTYLRIAMNQHYMSDKTIYFQVCISDSSLRPTAPSV